MMKAIIIEDEDIAARALIQQLQEVAPTIEVVALLRTIDESVEWIRSNTLPDVAFVDIHLADGSSFAIFEECSLDCPVIFTTAYDQYAIKAFEVNSIGYLLKPIDKEKLSKAIGKIKQKKEGENLQIIEQLIASIRTGTNPYKQNILITQQDKLIPLPVARIAYFYIDGRQVLAVTMNAKQYRIDQSLDELQLQLNPNLFFRVNRQYIVQCSAVKDLTQWFSGKYTLGLQVETPEKIIIPKAKVTPLKDWLSSAGE